MPAITLRHVTMRFGAGDAGESSPITRLVSATTRPLFSGGAPAHERRDQPEPRDREFAVDDLSLTIRDGETMSIVGPSGCGKTTLLKIIAGLVKPDAGEVLYDSEPISEIPISERGIGMVFQNYALYPHLESRDNIGFYDMIRHHPERLPERLRLIVDVMGVAIEHLLDRKPPTLSGGEQQRVAIARCLARDPRVFLFDEPLSNLDAKLRVETRIQIKRLLRHYRITSVYVTHDQTEAVALADRIAVMRSGKIEQVGTFEALYERPVNAFVAQFFGLPPMNLFPGRVYGESWEGSRFGVKPIRPGLEHGQRTLLGIRPEHVQVVDQGIPARIEHIEFNFPERRKLLYLALGEFRCVASVPLEAPGKRGERVQLAFPAEHIFLFDEASGQRVG